MVPVRPGTAKVGDFMNKATETVGTSSIRAKPTLGLVAGTVTVNALEFYDFIGYIFFAAQIGKAFFPAVNPLVSLLSSLAVFAVGFFFRPVGGLIIGAYADRAGRRPAMILTITLITIGTLGLILTPTYATIGVAAPIIVVFWRCLQGFALGGDVGPATSYLVEIAPDGQRGFYGAWQIASQGAAALVAGFVGLALFSLLGAPAMAAWGWRLVFLVGLLLIPVGLYLRRNMPETLSSTSAESGKLQFSWLAENPLLLLKFLFLVIGGTVATYVGLSMPGFAVFNLKYPLFVIFPVVIVFGLSTLAGGLLGGTISDRFGRKTAVIAPYALLWVTIYFAFHLLITVHSYGVLFGVTGWIGLLVSMSAGASLTMGPEILPARIRAFGMSMVYALGVTIFGGTTPFIIQALTAHFHNPMVTPIYVMVLGGLALIAMFSMPETRDRVLDRG